MADLPDGATILKTIEAAFRQQAPELCDRVLNYAYHPDAKLQVLLHDIASHILQTRSHSTQALVDRPAAPAQQTNGKKRKLDEEHDALRNGTVKSKNTARPIKGETLLSCADVSFTLPLRKKLKLQLVADKDNPADGAVRILAPDNSIQYTLHASHIAEVFSLPVPDKPQRQRNFLLFPSYDKLDSDAQILFTLPETPPKADVLSAKDPWSEEETYADATLRILDVLLEAHGKRVISPTPEEFASSIPQPHRRGEKAYHVKAFRGSKDGYLFFTSKGIAFGFRKPLSFFPLERVEAVSYTSVLQRTFNLVITTSTSTSGDGEAAEAEDNEFSMLDQADFAGIDAYVKRHSLNDASMAAERRAKAYNVNKERSGKTSVEGGVADEVEDGDDGLTELQRAEQMLQDREDEEEEDFEPEGGSSEGEGGSSGDDDEGVVGEESEEVDDGEEEL